MNKKHGILFTLGIVFVGVIMRGPIASVGPLASLIYKDLRINAGQLGLVTTLPLLVFAGTSLLIPHIAKKSNSLSALLLGLIFLFIGLLIRSSYGYVTLLLGTFLLGLGISFGNVIIPVIIKERAPSKIGVLTSGYLTSQSLFATLATALSFPLAILIGWRASLMSWLVPAFLVLAIWIIYRKNFKDYKHGENPIKIKSNIFRSKLAIYITMIMGLQSLCYYSLTAWLPVIFQGMDIGEDSSGYLASLFQLFSLPINFLTPIFVERFKKKHVIIIISGCSYAMGAGIIIFSSSTFGLIIALVFLAAGAGSSFSWVLAMIALVSKSTDQARQVSGMSQAFGYMIAALGPTLSGILYDLTLSWVPVLMLLIMSSLFMSWFGYLSRRYKAL